MAAIPFKVKAVYDYASQEADDLSFPVGQVITVTDEVDADWYEGEYSDVTGVKKAGIFPTNFVERYEPEVPSRPTRPSRPAKDAQPAIVSPPAVESQTKDLGTNDEVAEGEAAPQVPAQSKPAPIQQTPAPEQANVASKPEAPIVAASDSKKPPPVAPKSNAFKDRIAAFNAPAAAPIMPFAPGQGSKPSNFIKKPFVAPPPSKDAYVPPPRQDLVQKPYLREEDPEIRQRQEDDLAAAQSAGLVVEESREDAEDTPKPQSLKDRIALLQKQQMEQAQRSSVGGQKKEKSAPVAREEAGDDEESTQIHDQEATRERPQIPIASRPQQDEPMKRTPTIPQHEIISGGEEADQSAAGETTEDDAGTVGADESDERALPNLPAVSHTARETEPIDDEDTVQEETAAEADDDMDEDTRRRLELRERMAKMSGGMGMAGMFGPPGGMPMPGMGAPKKAGSREKRSTDDNLASSPPSQQARVPMVPIPGLQRVMSPEHEETSRSRTSEDAEDQVPAGRRSMTETRGVPPPIPSDRAVPPLPAERPVPIPPTTRPSAPAVAGDLPQTPGSESDDEAVLPQASDNNTPSLETPQPIQASLPSRSTGGPQDRNNPYFGSEGSIGLSDKRASRGPPVPAGAPLSSPRPPPPPPPTAAPQAVEDDDRGESEYEGDYDTDIASSAKRKDALKSHMREDSYDGSTTADEAPLPPPPATSRAVPPVPIASRAAPPPPPAHTQARPSRQSTEIPRAPPPVPPTRGMTDNAGEDDDDYDPYRYHQVPGGPPPLPQARPAEGATQQTNAQDEPEESSDDLYSAPVPRKSMERPPPPPPGHAAPQDRVPPPPPTRDLQAPPQAAGRQSLDVQQNPTAGRRSMEQGRPSGEHGQIANDLELSQSTPWWTSEEPLPPVLHGRNGVDLIFEKEESTTAKRGGKTTISKDVYILFHDYSQTVITARYDSKDSSDVTLEQRHEPAPGKLRQDQLETYWTRFGRQIAETANNLGGSKKETTVGDGSATSLVHELIKAQPEALLPVGTRAYGALVYANLANASVMQFDEIRPGDIVTLRNAKFEGKHSGPIHQKYKQELGPSHVAIVNEWDGTKKKIRVWEQGREKKNGLKSESYRLADLKSGEVRIWRVVGRAWVGWDSNA